MDIPGIWLRDVVMDPYKLRLGTLNGFRRTVNGKIVDFLKTTSDDEYPSYLISEITDLEGNLVMCERDLPKRIRCSVFVYPKKKNLSEFSEFISSWGRHASEMDLCKTLRLVRSVFIKTKAMNIHYKDLLHADTCLISAIVSTKPLSLLETYMDELNQFFLEAYSLELQCSRPLRECCFCGVFSEDRMKRCACRKGYYYCSKDCQRKDWRRGHRRICAAAPGREKKQK